MTLPNHPQHASGATAASRDAGTRNADTRTAETRTAETLVTCGTLLDDLRRLGLTPGMNLLVHASMSRIGWVCGGAQAIIEALLQAIGDTGTLMMPTHSTDLTEPSRWQAPAVPEDWWPVIRETMPPWDPDHTPTRGMGALAELFRGWRGVERSGHPYGSFAALGPASQQLLHGHRPGCAFGEDSPIGALNRLDGHVLLLGVDHANDTSLHLAEYRADWPGRRRHEEGAPMVVDGERRWVTFTELVHESDDFTEIGAAFEAAEPTACTLGRVGRATARLVRQRPLVDFAARWMEAHRR